MPVTNTPAFASSRDLISSVLADVRGALSTPEITAAVRAIDPTREQPSLRAEIARMVELELLAPVGRAGRGFTYVLTPKALAAVGQARPFRRPLTTQPQVSIPWPGEFLSARLREVARAAEIARERARGHEDDPLTRPEFDEAVRLLRDVYSLARTVSDLEYVPRLRQGELNARWAQVIDSGSRAEAHLREYPVVQVFALITNVATALRSILGEMGRRDARAR